MAGPTIILATVGSLGDLHPFIALGQALKARGAVPVLAVPEDHLAKCRAAGLEAEALLPTFAELGAATGLSDTEIVRRVIEDMDFLVSRILLPPLGDSVARLVRIGEGASVIAGSVFALATPIAAEALAIPFVPVMLQPMSFFSALDPPAGKTFAAFARPPLGAMGRGWNRLALRLMRAAMRARYGGRIDAVRAAQGLPRAKGAPIVEPGTAPALSVGLYSPELAPLPADAIRPSLLAGFAWFDSADGRAPVPDPALAAFLASGPPPLVVSLGSFVPFAADAFYREATAVARSLGLRAVLLTGRSEGWAEGAAGPDIVACPYAPHSLLFPHAAAIVHHGGVGTTGQALRAGRPQLVTPFMGDQYDHAARITRRGAGLSVVPGRFAAEAPGLIRRLIEDDAFAATARGIADRIALEDGAGAAADALIALAGR